MIKARKWRKVAVAGTALFAILATSLPMSIAQAEVKKLTINVNQSPWLNAY